MGTSDFPWYRSWRSEAGLNPTGPGCTWVPVSTVVRVLICAAFVAVKSSATARVCLVDTSTAGTAFLSGLEFIVGVSAWHNFIYRLVFLLLCLPQRQDGRSESMKVTSGRDCRTGPLR